MFFSSCVDEKQSFYSNLEGQWAISEIEYNGSSYKDYLLSNVLILKDGNRISIPETLHFEKDSSSTWRIVRKEKNVEIKSSNLAFNGIFEIEFINSYEENPFGMILKSDSIFIKAYKLLQYNNK